MSQAGLAGDRFSKEYVSQIERGKTAPSSGALDWIAARLKTDREYLEHGVHRSELERAEVMLERAESLLGEFDDSAAVDAYRAAAEVVGRVGSSSLSLRHLNGHAWALIRTGDVETAQVLLTRAEALVAPPNGSDVDRAEVIFRLGVCRYSRSEITEAIQLLGEALALVERSASASDELRSRILNWRSRCYRRQRDWVAAWEDIERALELAQSSGDSWRLAEVTFQASLVSQRQGRWVLARRHAETAKDLFEQHGDRATVARLLNNLAGLDHLLGDPARAVARLQEAFAIFVDVGLGVDAGYVLSSLADVYLSLGEFESAETQARKALELLGDRVDHLQEVGTAQLALGRALAGQQRVAEADATIAAAEATFERARSTSHRVDAWIARGDLDSLRGDDRSAADHYKRAVEAIGLPELDF
jgi:tetratricopeptide (TPR) repeat protein